MRENHPAKIVGNRLIDEGQDSDVSNAVQTFEIKKTMFHCTTFALQKKKRKTILKALRGP